MASEQYRAQRIWSNSTQYATFNVREEVANEGITQALETTNYLDAELGASTGLDNRLTSLRKSSCQCSSNMGLPCKHIGALYIHNQIFSFYGDVPTTLGDSNAPNER